MKRLYFLLTLLATCSLWADGGVSFNQQPWKLNGANISYTSGNIGIGTDSPSDVLEINGAYNNLRLCNPTAGGNQYVSFFAGLVPVQKAKFGYSWGSGDFEIHQTAGAFGINFITGTSSRLYIQYGGNIGVGTATPGTNFVVNGEGWLNSLYVTNDVNCGTLTDHSDSPNDAVEAKQMLSTFAAKDGKVDHAVLDPGLWGKKAIYTDTGLKQTNIVAAVIEEGKVIAPATTNVVKVIETTVVPDQTKRNLSMLVSAQALVIQDLLKRVEALEKR